VLDYGDVVIHVFDREARGFYDIESLWADHLLPLPEGLTGFVPSEPA